MQSRYLPLIQGLAEKTAKEIHHSFDAEVVRNLSDKFANDAAISQEAKDLAGYLSNWLKVARLTKWSLLGISLGCLITANLSTGFSRLLLTHSSLAGFYLAKKQDRIEKQSAPILGTIARIQAAESAMALTQLWKNKPLALSPVDESQAINPDTPINYFDWNLLESQPDRFPHIGIAGATGDGKSTVATHITKKSGGLVIAIDPHYRPGNYSHCAGIHAKGRNYGSWDDSIAADFSELTRGNLDYCSVLKTLEKEMDARYKRYEVGDSNFSRIECIMDEFNTFIETNPGALECYLKLLREARKVGIRLLFLLQSDSAKDMRLEGRTSARKCLKWVRLGDFALSHAQSLKDPAIRDLVGTQQYPMMMEGVPAKLD
jgi:hypothetical protein